MGVPLEYLALLRMAAKGAAGVAKIVTLNHRRKEGRSSSNSDGDGGGGTVLVYGPTMVSRRTRCGTSHPFILRQRLMMIYMRIMLNFYGRSSTQTVSAVDVCIHRKNHKIANKYRWILAVLLLVQAGRYTVHQSLPYDSNNRRGYRCGFYKFLKAAYRREPCLRWTFLSTARTARS